jgi:hypothetical protein
MPSLVSNGTAFSSGGQSAARATALWAALCVGLGLVVVFELAGGLPVAPQVTAAPAPSAEFAWPHEPIVFEPPPREELDIIAARPLFSPSRRPVVAMQVAAAAPATRESLPPLELIGVLLTDEQRRALIRPLDGNGPSWVREGEVMAGWRIEAIERSRVHLRAGDRLEVLELRRAAAQAASSSGE